jgi:ABC-type arginine transport system permease subunit
MIATWIVVCIAIVSFFIGLTVACIVASGSLSEKDSTIASLYGRISDMQESKNRRSR